MPKVEKATKEQLLQSLRARQRGLALSRAGCLGDPDCLRDLDEQLDEVKERIRRLQH